MAGACSSVSGTCRQAPAVSVCDVVVVVVLTSRGTCAVASSLSDSELDSSVCSKQNMYNSFQDK